MKKDNLFVRTERERERAIGILRHMNMKLFKSLQKY